MGTKEWEAEYEAHRFDDEAHEQLDVIRVPELVHARAVYMGSGVSEHPCGLNGALTATLVSDEVEDLTCPACLDAEKARIARLCAPLPDFAALALAAGLGYTHARPDPRTRLAPCGVRFDRGMSGNAGEPRTVTGRLGDSINCPGCLAAIGAVP